MKNQLKKIIHCVLITLILQSQVLSVQAAQVKFDEKMLELPDIISARQIRLYRR